MSKQLSVGEAAPSIKSTTTDGTEFDLQQALQESGVILYFYPKDSTPGCTTQACDFRDNWERVKAAGWRVVGVSKDSAASHEKFINKYDLPFDLLVDDDLSAHEAFGTWAEKKNYGRTYMGCVRSTFVISQDGSLAWVGYNVRAKGHVEKLMSELGIE